MAEQVDRESVAAGIRAEIAAIESEIQDTTLQIEAAQDTLTFLREQRGVLEVALRRFTERSIGAVTLRGNQPPPNGGVRAARMGVQAPGPTAVAERIARQNEGMVEVQALADELVRSGQKANARLAYGTAYGVLRQSKRWEYVAPGKFRDTKYRQEELPIEAQAEE